MTVTETLLSVWVPGRPKTKGSMTVVNGRRGVLREGVVGSKRWRQLMHYAITAAMAEGPSIFPIEGSVGVSAVFFLPVDDATSRSSGDVDKLARNLLDALTDARVYRDDVQVCALEVVKAPVGDRGPGVEIYVRSLPEGWFARLLRWLRESMRT